MLSFNDIQILNRFDSRFIEQIINALNKEESKLPMIEYLQVKIQSLIDETKFIRKMEMAAKMKAKVVKQRLKDGLPVTSTTVERELAVNTGLHHHRTFDVRKEARWSNIAYGCLNGKKYREIEPLAYAQPNWERIERLVMKYSELDSRHTAQKFAEWKSDALQGLKPNYNEGYHPGSTRGQWTEWMHEGRRIQAGVEKGQPVPA